MGGAVVHFVCSRYSNRDGFTRQPRIHLVDNRIQEYHSTGLRLMLFLNLASQS